ncbi:DUF6292 family protein [Spongiactinospora sp. TRM90649]|uniref:DUF6292 family protein n=1 Tax=Spongiactinospora sp. TRM90649 TaxID=3031114 RepID=UPI0023F86BFB|nr:DUF6292 family protein [Spongiactinospora sp. TRM90649]MDF5754772.1 DUF6292 family protein [Spongiactinospora sp. TRM90649]
MALRHVEPFTDEWRRQPGFYLRRVVAALGESVGDWWEDDPGRGDPRSATIRLADETLLVWDEESGWRLRAPAGHPGDETCVRYLCGGVLPRPERVPAALADARSGAGNSTAFRPCYRSHRHHRDGFDLALADYTTLSNA